MAPGLCVCVSDTGLLEACRRERAGDIRMPTEALRVLLGDGDSVLQPSFAEMDRPRGTCDTQKTSSQPWSLTC